VVVVSLNLNVHPLEILNALIVIKCVQQGNTRVPHVLLLLTENVNPVQYVIVSNTLHLNVEQDKIGYVLHAVVNVPPGQWKQLPVVVPLVTAIDTVHTLHYVIQVAMPVIWKATGGTIVAAMHVVPHVFRVCMRGLAVIQITIGCVKHVYRGVH
jgi:hypothetical protein